MHLLLLLLLVSSFMHKLDKSHGETSEGVPPRESAFFEKVVCDLDL